MSPASRTVASSDRGLGLFAFVFSVGTHAALVAGFFLLLPPSPPSPLPVFRVEVVQATEVAMAGETEASETAASESLSPTATAGPPGIRPIEPAPSEAVETVADAGESLAVAVPRPAARETSLPEPMQEPLPEEAPLAETVLLDPPKPARKPVVHEPVPSKVSFESTLAELKRPSSPAVPAESLGDATPIRVSAVAMRRQGFAKTAALTTGGGGDVDGRGDENATIAARYSGPGLSNPAPRYPYRARRKGQEGRAILRVEVTASGDAAAVRILLSSGYRLLDDAAVDAVRAWRFQPASRAGIPVAGLVDVPISFKLQDH